MTSHLTPTELTPDLAFVSQHLFTSVLWIDETLSITWLNAQAEQLLAISSGRLLNQSILTLLVAEDLTSEDHTLEDSILIEEQEAELTCSLTERFTQAKHYQQPFIDHDHVINTPLNGNLLLSVDYSVTPVIYEQQHYFIIEMWGKDRQSRISEEQRQQQQYSVARNMLRSVAHEIKNPLAGIRGAAQLLQRKFITFSDSSTAITDSTAVSNLNSKGVQKTAEKLRNYTDIIISETDRLSHLIGQLLGSNQLPNWQMLNIHEPLEHVITLVHNQYPQVTLQRDYDLSLPELQADKDQLIQVFLNLINNACESMTEFAQTLQQKEKASNAAQPDLLQANSQTNEASTQAHKSIDADYHPMLHIQTRVAFQHTISGQQHKQVLQVNITDNGSGIDPALIGQIFFPMVTSRAAGTGLGLSIVQDIISHHHGMIDVSSKQSHNHQSLNNNSRHKNNQSQTRFTLYLPFNQPIIDA